MKIRINLMKDFYLITIICFIFLCTQSCSVSEEPEYKGIESIKVIDADLKSVTISADAVFYNPNDVGGHLNTDEVFVYINEVKIARLSTERFRVPSKENFNVPLIVTISTDRIIDKKSLGGLLGSLVSQKVDIQYKGEIKYNVLGYSSSYLVDETKTLKIKI